MSQLSRLIAILTTLRSKRLVTAPQLADKYDVSIRTVYRDIRKLEAAGVPVVTIEGKGYALMEGYNVTAQQLVKQTKDSSFVSDFNAALVKIKSVFKTTIQEKSELLERKIYVFNTDFENISSHALSDIQLAITHFNYIEMHYVKANATTATHRKIEPYALYATNHKWILIAWCHLRDTYRAFRIDRIEHFKILTDTFEDRNFELQAYFQSWHKMNT
jgi:predicted DNA-binding transcriptional regulator YafY